METKELCENGPQVPRMCLGTWQLGGALGEIHEDQAIATVQSAIDAGLTFIDTAESYRTSEIRIGKAIRDRRHKVFIATKLSGDHSVKYIDKAIESSLKALGTDYIDLYQLHSPQPQWSIQQTTERLIYHRDAGRIRYIGLSNYSPKQTEEATQYGPVHSSQPQYSMLFRDVEEEVLPFCLASGIGVIAYSVLGQGLLSGKYRPGHVFATDDSRRNHHFFQGEGFERTFEVTERFKEWAADHHRDIVQLGIAWVLANPAVTSAIVGARSPEQVSHNVKAADWKLTRRDLEEIDAIQGDLRLHFEWT